MHAFVPGDRDDGAARALGLGGRVGQGGRQGRERVRAGQPLALIDPQQIDDQIRQQRAQIAANQAQVNQAQATVAEQRGVLH